jgi:hypothetical protein
MNRFALLVRLEAKPGKEAEVERLLTSALPVVEGEFATTVWLALRFGPASFGVFDAFPDQEGRTFHLVGRVPAAITAKASELFVRPPVIEKIDVLAEKISLTEAEVASPAHTPSSAA